MFAQKPLGRPGFACGLQGGGPLFCFYSAVQCIVWYWDCSIVWFYDSLLLHGLPLLALPRMECRKLGFRRWTCGCLTAS